jgi:FtsP/CotA-like multicopper oxidase with cupredoxin domain
MGCRRLLPLALIAPWIASAACRKDEAAAFVGAYGAAPRASGHVIERTIRTAPARLPLLDGKLLDVWAYDGQVPGPTLRVRLGDTLRVRFENALPQATTIHWHGVRVPNAMDGVPGVTQPAVEPGQSFVYEFTPPDAGTYWFHPHLRSSEQLERGLYGVLIVDDRDPLPFTADLVWVLDDWLIGDDGQIVDKFNTRHDLMHDGRWGNVRTVNGDRATRLVLPPGARVRLRLLDVANGRVMHLDFGALAPQVIAVDGHDTARPLPLAGFELAPGNRLDLDLRIPADAAGHSYEVVDRFADQATVIATIAVEGAPIATPEFATHAGALPPWRYAAERAPAAVLALDSRAGGEYGIEWTFNGQAMEHAGHHAPPPMFQLPIAKYATLRFRNDSYRLHPMHLHGLYFRVLARNGIAIDEPFFRDTVLVHPKESVDVATVPLDAGRWMMHCHILEHAEAGMMSLFEVR